MEQNNKLSISVLPGMRGDLEPHTAPPGTITLARNVRFPSGGVVQSRRGLAAIATTSQTTVSYADMLDTAQGPDFLHPCPGGFLFGAKGFAFRRDETGSIHQAGGYSTAQPRGRVDTIAREELSPVDDNIVFPWPLSCAAVGGYIVTCCAVGNAQTPDGTIVGDLRDVTDIAAGTSGAVLRVFTEGGGPPLLSLYYADMLSACVVVDGSNVAIVYQDSGGSETDIKVRVMTLGTLPTVGAASASLGTLSTAASFWAACSWSGQGWALAYQSAAGTITLKKLTGSTVSATQTRAITAGAGAPVSVYADTTHVYLGWALRGGGSYDAQAAVYDTSLTITSGGVVTVYTLGSANPYAGPPLFGPSIVATSAYGLVAHNQSGNHRVTETKTLLCRLTAAGALTAATEFVGGVIPLSSPFANGMWWGRHGSASQDGVQTLRSLLLDSQEDRASGTATSLLKYPKIALLCDSLVVESESQEASGGRFKQHLYAPTLLSTGEYVMGVSRTVRQEAVTQATQVESYLMLNEFLRFAIGCEQQVATCRDDILVTGSLACLSYSLGDFYVTTSGYATMRPSSGLDVGMLQMPGVTKCDSANTGSGALVVGQTYQYRFVSEFIDALGRRHRSAPSKVYSETLLVGNDSISVRVDVWHPLLRAFYENPTTSRIAVHGYRSVGNGSNFQRFTTAMGGIFPNLDGEIEIDDGLADTTLNKREFLYTDGGALANDHPPSCRFLAVTEERVWIAGLWDTRIAQSSKIIVPGEPVQFSDLPSFQVVCPDPITALASQDGQVIIFAKAAIYVVQGLGPNDQGQGAWDTPRCITRSTGCVDWRSVVETSAGVFYQSERGIMLLPRGAGEPTFIGMPVEELLESFGGEITGSAVCQTSDGNTVRFCTSGGTLIFDLEANAWSYDTPPASPVSTVHTKVCDAESGPTYARKVITSTFGFDQEQSALTSDTGGAIASRIEWAPVHPSGLAGWNTFTGAITTFGKLDGAAYPAAALTVTCNVDSSTHTVTKTSMADMGDVDYRRLHVSDQRQGCAATLAIETAAAPWRFVGWTLELEDLRGTRNISSPEVY
jgi:hypothetical protein